MLRVLGGLPDSHDPLSHPQVIMMTMIMTIFFFCDNSIVLFVGKVRFFLYIYN